MILFPCCWPARRPRGSVYAHVLRASRQALGQALGQTRASPQNTLAAWCFTVGVLPAQMCVLYRHCGPAPVLRVGATPRPQVLLPPGVYPRPLPICPAAPRMTRPCFFVAPRNVSRICIAASSWSASRTLILKSPATAISIMMGVGGGRRRWRCSRLKGAQVRARDDDDGVLGCLGAAFGKTSVKLTGRPR